MDQKRDTLFISHATPEDSPFTEWLYAQLTLAGYKCWCDIEGLRGGERDFSEEIQKIIRDDAVKFLLVFSDSTFTKDFVKDEFDYAKSIAKDNNLQDFIYPLRISNAPFNARIGLNRYNHFHFYPSWSQGLAKLLKRLHWDGIVAKPTQQSQILTSWVKNTYALDSGIVQETRRYYSNWWAIDQLPATIYVNQYYNERQADAVLKEDTVYPKIRHGNAVVAFEKNIPTICKKEGNVEVTPTQVYSIAVAEILKGYTRTDFPTYADANSFLKRLLKSSLKNALFGTGLSRHKMSGQQDCFFYKGDKERARKVKANYPGRKTRRTLYGRFGKNYWHWGISFKVLLEPQVCFSLKSHLIFTTNGFKKWDSDEEMFKARRKKGRQLYNREWRDFLMAMLHSLRDEDGNILLVFDHDTIVNMLPYTISFEAEFDYTEPTKESRISLLSDDFIEEEEEEFYETENETVADADA